MRKVNSNITHSYSRLVKVFFTVFVIFLVLITSLLVYFFYKKGEFKEKHTQLIDLNSELKSIDQTIHFQLSDGYINIPDLFLDFGDFQKQSVKYIGLRDLALLDSLARVGEVIHHFDLNHEIKHDIEIIHALDQIDELLLSSTDKDFFNDEGQIKTINQAGLDFKKSWTRLKQRLERSFLQAENDYVTSMDNLKRLIYTLSIIAIIILVALILSLLYYIYFDIIPGIFTLNKNVFKLLKGEVPEKDILKGELQIVQTNIELLYEDYHQTNKMLDLFCSDVRITDQHMESFQSNIFYTLFDTLRNRLKNLEENEKDRTWNLNGISLLTEITNRYSSEPKELFSQFLVTLVKYIGAVQGGIYVKETEEIMVLEASYAFDRLKKTHSVLNKGEGILGEVWAEEQVQYIENIPQDHFTIKSALGESKPISILAVPLIERGECYGILEISVFTKMDEPKQDFIIKSCEILSSATANIKSNQKTKRLLKDTQVLAEKLKEQEDENLGKIKDLHENIALVQQQLFKKDSEIKRRNFDLDEIKKKFQDLSNSVTENENEFRKRIKDASTNNSLVTELSDENEKLKKEIADLNETLHIRNLKLEKMRKKLSSDN